MSISNDLRQAVLQAAIQGKLTKQLPEDGSAKDLLEQIKAEKAKLIKEGNLKKGKTLPEITEDEIPFEIPENWEWVRVANIAFLKSGNQYEEVLNGNLYIKVADMNLDENSVVITTSIRKAIIPPKELIRENSIIFPKRGGAISTNKKRLVLQRPIGIDSNTMAMTIIFSDTFNFVVKWFDSIDLGKLASGTSVPQINNKDIEPLLIPLPPLAEQKRIVAKVEEMMAKIDELEKIEKELEVLKKAFPADMKASLLQAAMQGKLTEQLPEDGNAKDLLEQIKAEKAKLIKDGKLKKEKTLPEITEDEIPFDIPENWEWCRIGDVTYNRGQKKPDKVFCYIDVGSIDNKKCCLGTENNIVEPKDASSRARKIVKQDDVIYATIRPYLHNVSIINREFPFEMIASTAFAVMACWYGLNNKYLYYSLLSPMFDEYVNDSSNTKGVAYPAIGEKSFFNGIIPIPPLAEQKRIVEKLEKLLPLCDGLK